MTLLRPWLRACWSRYASVMPCRLLCFPCMFSMDMGLTQALQEHIIYTEAVRALVEGRVSWKAGLPSIVARVA